MVYFSGQYQQRPSRVRSRRSAAEIRLTGIPFHRCWLGWPSVTRGCGLCRGAVVRAGNCRACRLSRVSQLVFGVAVVVVERLRLAANCWAKANASFNETGRLVNNSCLKGTIRASSSADGWGGGGGIPLLFPSVVVVGLLLLGWFSRYCWEVPIIRPPRGRPQVLRCAVQAPPQQFKRLQLSFRYYSHQWRTWGGCILQAAWRHFRRRKLAAELSRQERMLSLQDVDYGTMTPPGAGAVHCGALG
ncbi:hypothetical protein SASPL_133887 [Salvia splendens]|uniref:Uncharacterized protein n=1 Tax=Salvia splendens TaxID=180675 RepID=A0A8X8ZII9_SALSN|nr:hypothetical protein SASPL_133887 [Salvia splendens]